MEKVQITIIGAGVIGLAIAAELGKENQDIVLVEKESSFGQGCSSRNSEVIHAGIYYPKDSLKAKLCVEGNRLLYDFCAQNNIPYKRIGKIIAAVDEKEVRELHELEQKAKASGVNDLSWLSKKQIEELESAVSAVAGLYSPSTGIIDSHSLMKCLEQKAKDNDVMISYKSEVTAIRKVQSGYEIELNKVDHFETEILINSAGLFSDKIAALAGIDIEKSNYKLHYCKGEYFSYNKPSFLKHLVYPVPEADVRGLGIHSVLDLAEGLKFGPSAEYVDEIDYKVDPSHQGMFYQAVKILFPRVKEDDLSPDQAGMRPKLQGPGEGFRDFVIKEESDNGFPRLVNLIGIESPGLTACLAIGDFVANLI